MKPSLKYLGWALAGGAVGAAIGILTAPASGRETRRRIAYRIDEEKERASGYLRRQVQGGKQKLAGLVGAA